MHNFFRPMRRLLGALMALCLAGASGVPGLFAFALAADAAQPAGQPALVVEPAPLVPGEAFSLRGIDLASATRESVLAAEGAPDEESDTHLLYMHQLFAGHSMRLLYMFDAESGALNAVHYFHISTARKLSQEMLRYEACTEALTLAYGEPVFFGDIWTPPEAQGEPGDLMALLEGRMRYETRWHLPAEPSVGVTLSLSCEEGGLLLIAGFSVVEAEAGDAPGV